MQQVPTAKWIRFGIASLLFILLVIWIGNYWILLGLPLLFDVYITQLIPWGFWKKTKDGQKPAAWKEWLDALLFALVAVYIINIFFFQNYKIPTSSLEKTLLVGDHLFVSKMSFGPRMPITPVSFPLVQNAFPILNTKSYTEWPTWKYTRIKGFGTVERNDIVVFNFPAGDTVAFSRPNPSYFNIIREIGQSRLSGSQESQMEDEYEQRQKERELGREYVNQHPNEFGEVVFRPVDRRDNYVKRCIALPGDLLEIRHNQVYINNEKADAHKGIQHNYRIVTDGTKLNERFFERMGISNDDRNEGGIGPYYTLPLTDEMAESMRSMSFIREITIDEIKPDLTGQSVFPYSRYFPWSRDNYGPVRIPKKGATVTLTPENLLLYERIIRNYEGNELTVKAGKIFINGEESSNYTFGMDYYFMMGDNRHKSADSRYWGFVPEDHVVGKPILVWLSLNKDRSFLSGIRWNRFFKIVSKE
jgi:signal peptidase I